MSTPFPQIRRRPASPGLRAVETARRVSLAALYWSPALFLLATLALAIGVWKRVDLGPVQYGGVAVLAVLAFASGRFLNGRLVEISRALERAQRTSTVGLLTAGFAHEMKNALTVVLGFAELSRTAAERSQPSDAKVVRNLRELEKEVRRTVAQLQSFLSYASGEKGPTRPRDPNELAAEALQMIRPMARMKELSLLEQWGQPPRVACDSFAVRQLLLNLLLNALDFARTRIVVASARAADGSCEISVRDDGPGVPEPDRARIFQRFVTTRAGGNGLGLSTSREIAEAHGGTLTLASDGPGACFVLRLPAAELASLPQGEPDQARA
ncbi:MAG TPA: HAMP domain-containing sensor histidine kinase [Myxococcales bacterium]|nr:HAMP domain-containing sensor histidine kinase [Myxococcales bacterium]